MYRTSALLERMINVLRVRNRALFSQGTLRGATETQLYGRARAKPKLSTPNLRRSTDRNVLNTTKDTSDKADP